LGVIAQGAREKDRRQYNHGRRSMKMFWKQKSVEEESKKERLPGPQAIPGLVQKHLVAEWKMDPDLVKLLKTVVRKNPEAEKGFNIRIFDESEASAKKVQVKDYTSLDGHPDLMIYEGQFDEGSKQVKLEEKKKVIWDIPIFTEAEIQQKIEALPEPGSTVFFYMARGTAIGGPLGMGAAIVELNPNYPGKKQKKYNVYPTDVVDMQPVGKGEKLFDSDKPKQIARWIKEAHHKRLY
jgi:hypothetical protein